MRNGETGCPEPCLAASPPRATWRQTLSATRVALKYITPFVLVMMAVVILVAYVPQFSLFMPNLVFGK